jgi:hypothetical protein
MPIDEILQENIKRLNLHPIYQRRLTPTDAEQVRLTQKWILPHKDLLLADIRALRVDLDRTFHIDPMIIERMDVFDKEYPYGLCKPIRDKMVANIKNNLSNPAYPGLQILHSFIQEGAVFQPFWGIDKGLYFQNAIQIGDAILDVANDTVDAGKEPVVLYPSLAAAPIKRIESFIEFARIAESYWKHDVYPNIYFPELAPVFPIISISPIYRRSGQKSHVLMLQTEAGDLQFKNLYTQHNGHLFGPAAHFLFGSGYSAKRLPSSAVERLRANAQLKELQKKSPRHYRVTTDPDEARKTFARFQLADSSAPVPRGLLAEADEVQAHGLALTKVILGEWK